MNLKQQLCGINLMIRLTIQLNGAECLILAEQCLCVLHKQRFCVTDVVLPGKVDGQVPLVQIDASINCLLHLPTLHHHNQSIVSQQTSNYLSLYCELRQTQHSVQSMLGQKSYIQKTKIKKIISYFEHNKFDHKNVRA